MHDSSLTSFSAPFWWIIPYAMYNRVWNWVSTFWLGSDTWGIFLYTLPSHHMNLRDQPWKIHILWRRTDICSCKHSAKVSLMLDKPFPVPSLCKLNHISICFIQTSQQSPADSFLSGTRRPGDVPWRSPKGLNVRDLQGTFKELLEDQQKNWWFDEKSVFRCNSLCFTHLLLFLTGKTNIQKF